MKEGAKQILILKKIEKQNKIKRNSNRLIKDVTKLVLI